MAAAAEAEQRRQKVKLLLTNILGTNGQPSVTHVPFFCQDNPMYHLPNRKSIVQPSPVGPNISLLGCQGTSTW
jgi:hypothetical protein